MTQNIGIHDLEPTDLKDEQEEAYRFVVHLISEFLEDNRQLPTKLYASDQDELQSWIMLAGQLQGLKPYRTSKRKSYVA